MRDYKHKQRTSAYLKAVGREITASIEDLLLSFRDSDRQQKSTSSSWILDPHTHRLPVVASASFHYLQMHQITSQSRAPLLQSFFRLLHAGTLYRLAGSITFSTHIYFESWFSNLYKLFTAWDWQINASLRSLNIAVMMKHQYVSIQCDRSCRKA